MDVAPFSYLGGKRRQLSWLLPLLPDLPGYVEPFCGSAAVLLNRAPAMLETINDRHGAVVNFFRVLRDSPDDLIRLLELTPYAREEYEASLDDPGDLSPLERARRFYVQARMTMLGCATRPSKGRWHLRTIPQGNEADRFQNCLEPLPWIADRLARVQIECDDAIKVIQRMDHPDTLIYCDPPYPKASRKSGGSQYEFDMTDDDHARLARVLHGCQAKVAVSGYAGGLMEVLYSDWLVYQAAAQSSAAASIGVKGVHNKFIHECLWMNYDPPMQMTMFE